MGTRKPPANRLAKKVAHRREFGTESNQVGADTDSNQDIAVFFASTRLFIAVLWHIHGVWFSILDRQLYLQSFQRLHHFWSTLQNPNWLTAPFCCRHLTWFQVEISTSTGAPAALARSDG